MGVRRQRPIRQSAERAGVSGGAGVAGTPGEVDRSRPAGAGAPIGLRGRFWACGPGGPVLPVIG